MRTKLISVSKFSSKEKKEGKSVSCSLVLVSSPLLGAVPTPGSRIRMDLVCSGRGFALTFLQRSSCSEPSGSSAKAWRRPAQSRASDWLFGLAEAPWRGGLCCLCRKASAGQPGGTPALLRAGWAFFLPLLPLRKHI